MLLVQGLFTKAFLGLVSFSKIDVSFLQKLIVRVFYKI
ncbi:hypothetical protein AcetOrient_orf04827 [Acetobacter orientalis]|uniref:Uncharacterized protein n=1 Tax=Acetobacter orientalis TaxID=146474 RepID=A0A2Z5ZMY4_9PROT|nr:hypothetical protein AcetOrient_orf04827 [Acetobacter orientalis]